MAQETALSEAFTRRIAQLGLSRREVAKQAEISRQTIYKIECEGHTELKDSTYQALDRVLHWYPGTARALAQGLITNADDADTFTARDREHAYRWEIVLRIASLPHDDLAKVIAFIDLQHSDKPPVRHESLTLALAGQ